MDIEGEECPSDISTGEREIVSRDCLSNMDLDTNWLEEHKGPLMSPDHHYLPSPPLSPSRNFQQMSPPPLSPLWTFSVHNWSSSTNWPYCCRCLMDIEGEEWSLNLPTRERETVEVMPTGGFGSHDKDVCGRDVVKVIPRCSEISTWSLKCLLSLKCLYLERWSSFRHLDCVHITTPTARWSSFWHLDCVHITTPTAACMIEHTMTQSLWCMIGRIAEYVLSLVPEHVKNGGYQCTLTITSNELQQSKVASLLHMFSLDDARAADDPAGLHTIPSSSVKLKLPFWTPNVKFNNHKDSSSCWGANIDQCYTVRGTLILPVFDCYRGLCVLELVMTSSKISYAYEHVEAIRSPANEELDSRIDCFSHQGLENGRDVLLESGRQFLKVCVAFKNGRKVIHHAGQSRQSAVAFSDRKGTGTGKSLKITPRKRRETTTLEVIQQHFGQSLVDAAKSLNVSRSTLKRHCRKLGITQWPSKMMTSEGPVPISESVQSAGSCPANASQLPSSITSVGSNQLNSKFHGEKSRLACYQRQNFLSSSPAPDRTTDQLTPAIPCFVTSGQDNHSSVMTTIKAAYADINIKFQIDSAARRLTDQLKDGVAKRLRLQDGSYEMMYKDDDDDLILINCDEDVQECIRNSTILGSKAVKLYLRDKSSSSKRGVKRKNHHLIKHRVVFPSTL